MMWVSHPLVPSRCTSVHGRNLDMFATRCSCFQDKHTPSLSSGKVRPEDTRKWQSPVKMEGITLCDDPLVLRMMYQHGLSTVSPLLYRKPFDSTSLRWTKPATSSLIINYCHLGATAAMEAVRKLMVELNIQLDNLLQVIYTLPKNLPLMEMKCELEPHMSLLPKC